MEIRIQPSAEKDIDLGFSFYEQQHVGIGDHLIDAVFSDINKLKITVGIHSK